MLKKLFGIPSWLPDKEPDRTQRQGRINRLFKQLNDLWPSIDILVIAQNWQDFKPIKTKNKQIIKTYEPLGILKARQTLREEFLKLDYDYIIMAVGSKPDSNLTSALGLELTKWGSIVKDENLMTSKEGVFVGGDLGDNKSTVAFAGRSGSDAAEKIIDFLQKK